MNWYSKDIIDLKSISSNLNNQTWKINHFEQFFPHSMNFLMNEIRTLIEVTLMKFRIKFLNSNSMDYTWVNSCSKLQKCENVFSPLLSFLAEISNTKLLKHAHIVGKYLRNISRQRSTSTKRYFSASSKPNQFSVLSTRMSLMKEAVAHDWSALVYHG